MQMLTLLLDNKEWLFSGIGGAMVVGIAMRVVVVAKRLSLGTKIFAESSQLQLRRYRGYYISYQEVIEGHFLKSRILIEYSWPARLRARFRSREWDYRGDILIEQTVVTISLSGVGHRAASIFVLKDPPFEFNVLTGVYAGFSRDRLPIAGRAVLRKVEAETYNSSKSESIDRDSLPGEIRRIFDEDRQDAIVVPDLGEYNL